MKRGVVAPTPLFTEVISQQFMWPHRVDQHSGSRAAAFRRWRRSRPVKNRRRRRPGNAGAGRSGYPSLGRETADPGREHLVDAEMPTCERFAPQPQLPKPWMNRDHAHIMGRQGRREGAVRAIATAGRRASAIGRRAIRRCPQSSLIASMRLHGADDPDQRRDTLLRCSAVPHRHPRDTGSDNRPPGRRRTR